MDRPFEGHPFPPPQLLQPTTQQQLEAQLQMQFGQQQRPQPPIHIERPVPTQFLSHQPPLPHPQPFPLPPPGSLISLHPNQQQQQQQQQPQLQFQNPVHLSVQPPPLPTLSQPPTFIDQLPKHAQQLVQVEQLLIPHQQQQHPQRLLVGGPRELPTPSPLPAQSADLVSLLAKATSANIKVNSASTSSPQSDEVQKLRHLLDEAHKTLKVQGESEREKDGLMAQLGKRVRELETEVEGLRKSNGNILQQIEMSKEKHGQVHQHERDYVQLQQELRKAEEALWQQRQNYDVLAMEVRERMQEGERANQTLQLVNNQLREALKQMAMKDELIMQLQAKQDKSDVVMQQQVQHISLLSNRLQELESRHGSGIFFNLPDTNLSQVPLGGNNTAGSNILGMLSGLDQTNNALGGLSLSGPFDLGNAGPFLGLTEEEAFPHANVRTSQTFRGTASSAPQGAWQPLPQRPPNQDAKDQLGHHHAPSSWDFNTGPLSKLVTVSGTPSNDSLANRQGLSSDGLDVRGPSLDQLTAQLLKDTFH